MKGTLLLLFFGLWVHGSYGQEMAAKVNFEALSCNSIVNPVGIDSPQPLFSWIVGADGFGREQTAYQILVASSLENLAENKAGTWNSQAVKSAQSANVKYHGKALLPARKYWWKVKIWDEKGHPSDWSPANSFEMGLMNESNWGNAQWLSVGEDTRTSAYRFREYQTSRMEQAVMVTSNPAGYFREVIDIGKEVKSARAYICGLGYYELYINGEKTGDHVLDPAPSNYDQQAYYVVYDVTDQLAPGNNALGILLGNGFYGQSISWKNDPESERDLSYRIPAVRLRALYGYG